MDMIFQNIVSGGAVALIGFAFEYFRRAYKRTFQELEAKIDAGNEEQRANYQDMKRDTLRNRILTLIYDDPHSHLEILDLFDQYEKLGGNGATKERIIEWKKREGLD